ncbi:hypothetical protein GOP47_0011592 [Adiantum capillus-veneris]|uniref:Annexin n=1 Tax=Adiantum capillus-veneris TaxID=13818 RepID=A0A9D4UT29_ADICA|nr:hypothetical protein GOP47_0011592 [Adiantum capillus-veneris]
MSTIIVPNPVPDPNEDCIALRDAFADIGCDKKAVLDVICHRNQQQRHKIRIMYNGKYEEDLLQRLRSELHSNLEKAAVLWMCDPAERDALIVSDALKSLNKDQAALAEVLYLRTSAQLLDIRRAYASIVNRSLEEDIATKMSGDEKKLLLAFLRQERTEDEQVDASLADTDAKELLAAVSNRKAIDKATIIRILSTRNPSHLKAILDYYKLHFGHSLGKVLKQETQGGFRSSSRVAMKCAKNRINYFSKCLLIYPLEFVLMGVIGDINSCFERGSSRSPPRARQ